GREAGDDHLAFVVSEPCIDGFERGELVDGQARIGFLAFTQQDGWIEPAGEWVFNDAVLYAVARVALRERRGLDRRELHGGNVTARFGQRRPDGIGGGGEQIRPVISGRSGDDSVIVVRITLGFHKGLPATVRARVEVRPFRRFPIEGADDGFGAGGRL